MQTRRHFLASVSASALAATGAASAPAFASDAPVSDAELQRQMLGKLTNELNDRAAATDETGYLFEPFSRGCRRPSRPRPSTRLPPSASAVAPRRRPVPRRCRGERGDCRRRVPAAPEGCRADLRAAGSRERARVEIRADGRRDVDRDPGAAGSRYRRRTASLPRSSSRPARLRHSATSVSSPMRIRRRLSCACRMPRGCRPRCRRPRCRRFTTRPRRCRHCGAAISTC